MVGRPKKRKKRYEYPLGHSFGGNGTVLSKGSISRKRLSRDLCELAKKNTGIKSSVELPGIRLRPKWVVEIDEDSDLACNSNEIIDFQLQQSSYQNAHKSHKLFASARKSTRHVPTLIMKKTANLGFGVKVRYLCSRCKFVSEEYNLYTTTATGAVSTNVQTGIAFSKTCIKPSDGEFLFQSVNLSCPSRNTMQKHFSRANESVGEVLEDTLVENRGFIRDYVEVTSLQPDPSSETAIENKTKGPKVTLSSDGRFDQPVFHGYNGKAACVSQPFLEEETDLHLLAGYAVVSKRDGSYHPDKVKIIVRL